MEALMMSWPLDWTDVVLFVTMASHVFFCPFTKVEESFNMQAVHDVLYHRENLSQYDHLEFPGVVPRTFLGPLAVSALVYPSIFIKEQFLTYDPMDKFFSQIKARLALGLLVFWALLSYKRAVGRLHGEDTAKWLMLILASQFHFVFYMSRPLPNTFALAIVLYAVSCCLCGHYRTFIWSSGLSILVFRAELCVLLGLLLLSELWTRRLSLTKLLIHAVPAATLCLGLTVPVDSWFWGRWLWPEGEVLWYNTVLNKSSNWGTQPYLWYLYSALPRALLSSVALLPVGLFSQSWTRRLFLVSLGFVLLYSLLPHKELRFVMYVVPLWDTVAAAACTHLWRGRRRSLVTGLLSLMVISHLVVNACTTALFTFTSYHNYPGGWAMQQLHQLVPPLTDVHVHIDVLACQTGVSRFTQLHDHWVYNKTEDLSVSERLHFSHLIVPASSGSQYTATHTQLASIPGYRQLHLDTEALTHWPAHLLHQPNQALQLLHSLLSSPSKLFTHLPIRVLLEPKLLVLKRM